MTSRNSQEFHERHSTYSGVTRLASFYPSGENQRSPLFFRRCEWPTNSGFAISFPSMSGYNRNPPPSRVQKDSGKSDTANGQLRAPPVRVAENVEMTRCVDAESRVVVRVKKVSRLHDHRPGDFARRLVEIRDQVPRVARLVRPPAEAEKVFRASDTWIAIGMCCCG
jgi:hypothetical protein